MISDDIHWSLGLGRIGGSNIRPPHIITRPEAVGHTTVVRDQVLQWQGFAWRHSFDFIEDLPLSSES